jgi:membrane protein YdbS with pleckstrin-like domain
VIPWLTSLLGRIETLIQLIGTVGAVVFVIWFVAKHKTLIALLQALLIAAVFVWGLYNVRFLRQKVEVDAGAVMVRPGWTVLRHLDVPTIPQGALQVRLPR